MDLEADSPSCERRIPAVSRRCPPERRNPHRGFLLDGDAVFLQKPFQLSTGDNSVLARIGFQILLQNQKPLGNVIFPVICHTRTPQKFFSIVSHQKQRKKSAFQILAVDICGRMWYDNRAKPTL